MNLETIKDTMERSVITEQAKAILETVLETLEGEEVDECDIENAVLREVCGVYSFDTEESLEYLKVINCNYFGDLIDMGLKSASEFACYNLNEEIVAALRDQEIEEEKEEEEED